MIQFTNLTPREVGMLEDIFNSILKDDYTIEECFILQRLQSQGYLKRLELTTKGVKTIRSLDKFRSSLKG